MTPTVVLNVVGLTGEMLGANTPHLSQLASQGGRRALKTVLPAVTCSVQSTFTTGTLPSQHGCVANGWYFRDVAEVALWKQSNRLVQGEKIWEAAKRRDPGFTCAKLFWWFNMYSAAEISVTPRPIYWADGLKLPDFYTHPPELHGELKAALGDFPLFQFWGPGAGLPSTRWIADCARHVLDTRRPTLTLVYLPHLDYDLQRLGPGHPDIAARVREVDAVAGELSQHAVSRGARVVVLSEYAITEVRGAVHINRALREAGLVAVRAERGLEKLDAGASRAFAVADHQVAHVYVREPRDVGAVKALLEKLDGVEQVLDAQGKREAGLDHPNSGELVAVSAADRWFTYYYWFDDAVAPEYARTVDIHRKPGYDPCELFMDPALAAPKLRVGWTLVKKLLGFRYLMDVTPLDASLVKGSHGRLTEVKAGPVLLSSERRLLDAEPEVVDATQVKRLVLSHLFD
jgi:predicted AlkP superfamily pyrophosphatase or phosphodiesterase